MKKFFYLEDVLKKIGINQKLCYKKNIQIKNIADLSSSKKNYLSFFSSTKYLKYLKKTKASAILVSEKLKSYIPKNKLPIICENPELYFIKVQNLFFPDSYFSKLKHQTINPDQLKYKNKTLTIGINFYIERDVEIGKNVRIGNNVTIKSGCVIGNNVIIGSNVVIECSVISDDVYICDGSIIGKKGFGFKFVNNKCLRIPHVGKVLINRGCEIGANCVIDRGSIRNTIIGEDTFIDNLVHIAHNVVIGQRCILAAQVGIAGSTTIGDHVIIGGQAGISGHLKIGNNVKIGGKSGVIKNIKDNEVVMGYPATSFRQFVKNNKQL